MLYFVLPVIFYASIRNVIIFSSGTKRVVFLCVFMVAFKYIYIHILVNNFVIQADDHTFFGVFCSIRVIFATISSASILNTALFCLETGLSGAHFRKILNNFSIDFI